MDSEDVDSGSETSVEGEEADAGAAHRAAAVPGETLESIPENWDLRASVSPEGDREHWILHIPKSDVSVQLSRPIEEDSAGEEFTVDRVGEFSVVFDDELEVGLIKKVILMGKTAEELPTTVRKELKRLADQPDLLERELAAFVDEFAEQTLFKKADPDGVVHLDGWTVSPWEEPLSFDEEIATWVALTGSPLEGDELQEFKETLVSRKVIPTEPEVRVEVIDGKGLPQGFYLQGLIEAGCEPVVATDYLMTQIRDLTQKEWTETRDRTQATISGNISKARDQLGL